MNCCCNNSDRLPDIEMYGGDTTPWQINIVNKNGSPFIIDPEYIDYYSAKLLFAPLKSSYGMNENSSSSNIMLEKDAIISIVDETLKIVFDMKHDDTINLRGKFIYQIEIRFDDNDTHVDDNVKINQGIVYIKQNLGA